LASQQASDRLRAALDPRSDWLPEVIKNAHERLMTIRSEEGHPNAGGLIVCRDQAHAKAIAELVKKITGTEPAVAYSDIPEASEIINKFKGEDRPWIVTVRMVSEGVDIKRLRVGIYATAYKTRLFFQQVIARTTRYDSSVAGLARDGQPVEQPAWFYVPDDPDLQEFMSQMMEISIHHIADNLAFGDDENEDMLGTTDYGQYTFLDAYEFVNGEDARETGHFYDERKWTPEEMDRDVRVFDGVPAFDHVPPAAKALAIERLLSQQPAPPSRSPEREQPSAAPTEPKTSAQKQREKLKHACSTETRRFTFLLMQINQGPKNSKGFPITDLGVAIAIVTKKINAKDNVKSVGDCTNEQLEKRRALLAQWISDVSRNKWDPSQLP
jgi:hypothetical protein